MTQKFSFVLSPELLQLGYEVYPPIIKLNELAFIELHDQFQLIDPWHHWRDILEYLGLIEYARIKVVELGNVPLGSSAILDFRYHTLNIVFITQALIDNAAQWIKDSFHLKLKGSEIAFKKTSFQKASVQKVPNLQRVFDEHKEYIEKVSNYRDYWIHRLSGGAEAFSDNAPGHVNANIRVLVQLDPSISIKHGEKSYLDAIERTRAANNGEWLIPAEDFANWAADGAKSFILALLDVITETELPTE